MKPKISKNTVFHKIWILALFLVFMRAVLIFLHSQTPIFERKGQKAQWSNQIWVRFWHFSKLKAWELHFLPHFFGISRYFTCFHANLKGIPQIWTKLHNKNWCPAGAHNIQCPWWLVKDWFWEGSKSGHWLEEKPKDSWRQVGNIKKNLKYPDWVGPTDLMHFGLLGCLFWFP